MDEQRTTAVTQTGHVTQPATPPAAPGSRSVPADVKMKLLLREHFTEVKTRLDAFGEELRHALAALPTGAVPPLAAVAAAPPPAAPPAGAMPAAAATAPAAPVATRPELVRAPLLALDVAAQWGDWTSHLGTERRAAGEIEVVQPKGQPGVISPAIAAPSCRLLCVRVTIAPAAAGHDMKPYLRMVNEAGGPLGPDMKLGEGTSEHVFFLPRRTKQLHAQILLGRPRAGQILKLLSLELLSIDEDSWRAQVRHDVGAPVIASMASIPQRRTMLADAVDSLTLQCDRVRVFLNNYEDVPAFLSHPKVEVRRSQDRDDKGDAGKFGWIDHPDEPGYRIIVDDDLIFPPNFATAAVAALRRYDDHAFVGLHGVLLRQPVTRYYDPNSRTALHFAAALASDATVHVLGTNAFAYHSAKLNLTWADFQHRNMADIFIANYAQAHAIPMIAMSRPKSWVIENKQDEKYETIYEASVKATRSRFDSSLVQDALVKQAWPLTLQPTMRPKIVVCLLAASLQGAKAALEAWQAHASAQYDWALVLCRIGRDPELREWLDSVRMPRELHLVSRAEQSPVSRLGAALELARRLGGNMLCLATEELRVAGDGWVQPLLEHLRRSPGTAAFGQGDGDGAIRLDAGLPAGSEGVPALIATTPALAAAAGDVDPRHLNVPEALMEWAGRLSMAQGRHGASVGDIAVSPALAAVADARLAAPPALGGPKLAQKVGWRRVTPPGPAPRTINDFFQRVCVLNADGRAAQWSSSRRRLDHIDVRAERVAEVDAEAASLQAEFAAYAQQPLVPQPAEGRPVTSMTEFFRDHDSQMARLAFWEAHHGRKGVASAAVWARLATWQQILEAALEDQIETLLVLDDGVVFHSQAKDLFASAIQDLPADWMVLQLGTMQHEWDLGACRPVGRHLYTTHGVVGGALGVGLRSSIFPFMLEAVKRRDMPFELGALSTAALRFAKRCFVMSPNLVIRESDDGMVHAPHLDTMVSYEAAAAIYRWHLPDYNL